MEKIKESFKKPKHDSTGYFIHSSLNLIDQEKYPGLIGIDTKEIQDGLNRLRDNVYEIYDLLLYITTFLHFVHPDWDIKEQSALFYLENIYVAGGAIRDSIRNDEIKDWDIFPKDYITRQAMMTLFTKETIDFLNENDALYTYEFIESKFKNLNVTVTSRLSGKIYELQFCVIKYRDPNEMIEHFDFTINQCYVDLRTIKIHSHIFNQNFKWLVPVKEIEYPLNALIRVDKFLKKGYRIYWTSYKDLAQQIVDKGNQDPEMSFSTKKKEKEEKDGI